MSYIVKASLSNAQHPERGQVTVPFPIPSGQYDQTIEALQEIDLGFSVNRDCTVTEIDSAYSVLEVLKGSLVNVDQLDYLAKRLDSFNEGEASQFQAMAHKLELSHIKDLINLTFCCQRATVITSFSDLEKIGRYHIMTLNGGIMLKDQYEAVDGRKEALQLIQSGSGTVTPITEERQKLLEGMAEQIRTAVPDLEERVSLSNQKEMEFSLGGLRMDMEF